MLIQERPLWQSAPCCFITWLVQEARGSCGPGQMCNRRTDEISFTPISQKPVSLVCSHRRKCCCIQWWLSCTINLERCYSYLPGEAFCGQVWMGHSCYPLLTCAEHRRMYWNVYFHKLHSSQAGVQGYSATL